MVFYLDDGELLKSKEHRIDGWEVPVQNPSNLSGKEIPYEIWRTSQLLSNELGSNSEFH